MKLMNLILLGIGGYLIYKTIKKEELIIIGGGIPSLEEQKSKWEEEHPDIPWDPKYQIVA